MNDTGQTLNIVVSALGGEGGGVLADWIAEVAAGENWLSQTTSVPGVAQRTGATIYYVELFPRSGAEPDHMPVMALFPTQGDVDIVVASEIAEAGRMVQRGFVSPDRTTLIASDHRVYSIAEKMELADGTIDASVLQEIAGKQAKQFIHFDMLSLARDHNTVISATLFGALAGAGALPFARESFEAVIRRSGIAVEANLAAFGAGFERARSGGVETFEPAPPTGAQSFHLPEATTEGGRQLLARLRDEFPASTWEILCPGIAKLVDYQDFSYSNQYLDKLKPLLEWDSSDRNYELTRETGRYLALWMAFEDIARVAQFKTRRVRMDKLREEVRADEGQLVYVTEYFRPQVEEICAYLPPRLGDKAIHSPLVRKILQPFTGGKKIRTNTIAAYLMLRITAALRRFRRSSWVYHHEHVQIERWLAAVLSAAGKDYDLALSLAELGRMVKGYGETRRRTSAQVAAILEKYEQGRLTGADAVEELRRAALADDEGESLAAKIAA